MSVCFLQGELTVSYQVGGNTEQGRRLKLDTRGYRVSKRRARSCLSARTYLEMERAGVETSLSNRLHIQEGRMVFGAAESSKELTSSSAAQASSSEGPDVSHGSNNTSGDHKSEKKYNSTGDIFCNSPDPASAPLAPHVDVLPHAHTRTCARIHTPRCKSRRHPLPYIGVMKTA